MPKFLGSFNGDVEMVTSHSTMALIYVTSNWQRSVTSNWQRSVTIQQIYRLLQVACQEKLWLVSCGDILLGYVNSGSRAEGCIAMQPQLLSPCYSAVTVTCEGL